MGDVEVCFPSRKLEIMSLWFRTDIGIQGTAKQESMVEALIIHSTGRDPRDIFAVTQTLGRK